MTLLGGCLLSAGVFVASIVGGPQRAPLRFDDMHHAYLGAAVCGVGVVTHSRLLQGIGLAITVDDAAQHMAQRVTGDLGLRSPMNIGYRLTLGKIVPVARLGAWLDHIF